jgi:hypothetical protein
MAMPRLSQHALNQMEARGVSQEDVRLALNRRSGDPVIANNGKIKVFGYATGGRILKLVLTPDQSEIITLAWPDE